MKPTPNSRMSVRDVRSDVKRMLLERLREAKHELIARLRMETDSVVEIRRKNPTPKRERHAGHSALPFKIKLLKTAIRAVREVKT